MVLYPAPSCAGRPLARPERAAVRRLVRLVLAGHALGCLPLALALASAASHPDPFRQLSVPDAPDDVARAAALAAQYQQQPRRLW